MPDDDEMIEAYCVSCKTKVFMEEPTPVYTRRGAPGTRGVCPSCGSTVFRMGRTEAHSAIPKPSLENRPEAARSRTRSVSPIMAFINYAPIDLMFARQLAADLEKMGIPSWVEFDDNADQIQWASGVHPAFEECTHMVVVLSSDTLIGDQVRDDWETFQTMRKPVFIAQIAEVAVPDDLRRRPRYDFTSDYKTAFRQLIQELMT
ncbi:MAG: toll/interleukin-1 receptor domain-containing protein [Chloroflexi bacterium]|nr:toll/interleukin-1 receptor domain-containing protein [Chloroflexota bacterium]